MASRTLAAAHRMAEPALRVRVLALIVALVTLAWVAVTLAGRSAGPFGSSELRDLSGVPVPPPQISGRVGPGGPSVDDLSRQLEELRRRVEGTQLPPGLAPTPSARATSGGGSR
jgi:hypothetical protein